MVWACQEEGGWPRTVFRIAVEVEVQGRLAGRPKTWRWCVEEDMRRINIREELQFRGRRKTS